MPPTIPPGQTTSLGQSGGVTAGSVGTVNQVLPTLVRGPQLERFKRQFTMGAKLLRTLRYGLTDEHSLEVAAAEFDRFSEGTERWLRSEVSEYAAERFMFTQPTVTSWTLTGIKDPGNQKNFQIMMELLPAYLSNLDLLMRDPSIYGDGVKPHDNVK